MPIYKEKQTIDNSNNKAPDSLNHGVIQNYLKKHLFMVQTLKNRNFWMMLIGDAFLVFCSYYLAHYFRFDGKIPLDFFIQWQNTVIWIIPVKLLFFFIFDLYRGMWRYTSIHDTMKILKACITSSALTVFLIAISVRLIGFSRGVFAIDFFLTFLFISGFRLSIRMYFIRNYKNGAKQFLNGKNPNYRKILIIGAGSAGEKLLRDIIEHRHPEYYVSGFVDDNPNKVGQTIHGIPVLGVLSEMERLVKKHNIDELMIAAPSASAEQIRNIVTQCDATGLPFKTLPELYELMQGRVSVSTIRDVRYEDLLGRFQVDLDDKKIGDYLKGKRVLVSGGAGSIGSELCRQIATFKPENLIIFDQNESGLYNLEIELKNRYPDQKFVNALGSIHSNGRLTKIFEVAKPSVVFHAAAYKHVPMMELHPWEAVYNNILGTQSILELCREYRVEKCVIVSTDKAVRPTSIMGASKRVIELLTQVYAKLSQGACIAVRFGNVIGSSGSVVPLFKHQIERGGPVTVTHPDATRYFMTITEASGLILQAGSIGMGGEIFLLRMGTPIRIAEMARDMISLSGLKPYKDIQIEYVGLRPGEKLVEELVSDDEEIRNTEYKDLMVLKTNGFRSLEEMNASIKRLINLAEAEDANGIIEEFKRIVPEYEPNPKDEERYRLRRFREKDRRLG